MDLEQALEASEYALTEEQEVLVIDPDTRTITLPQQLRFGVKGDKDVERKYFQCPKIVGDNIDLSKHQIYISYVAAQAATITSETQFQPDLVEGLYHCDDVAVDGDNITFSWKITDNVVLRSGYIAFKVQAKYTEGAELKTRWNTAPAVGNVLLTVPDTSEEIEQQYPDVINQILQRLKNLDGMDAGDFEQIESQLIVSYTLTADDASKLTFVFTSEDYPMLAQCNEFFIRICDINESKPYYRIKVNDLGERTNAGGYQGLTIARLSLYGKMLRIRMSDWFNTSLKSSATGNVATREQLIDQKIPEGKVNKIALSSYTAWLNEGGTIEIFGWRI